eukprot:CAMPEP_0176031130 /NCGR_PEP_ID=MMETSP0120_2-20121206/15338_1 /TAXON_ID=160619 /ORGANISM="Kryptoperidinium foliaceum, Strain CCMP 1326" /LENGTH=43 /DNA_ID= /DNA_START= /DNA_END= /DNA_ORIENTATION=
MGTCGPTELGNDALPRLLPDNIQTQVLQRLQPREYHVEQAAEG